MSKAKEDKTKEPASVPKYEIISGPSVHNALCQAIEQFEEVRNKRTKKLYWAKKSSFDQTKIDYAIKLADKFKLLAGRLNPGSKNALEALQKIQAEVK